MLVLGEEWGGGGGGMRRGKGGRNGLLPSSLRIISSCLKTVSSNAGSVASTVRSAGASVAASIAPQAEDEKDQVRSSHTLLPSPPLPTIQIYVGFLTIEASCGSS